ncbi:RNA polymerase sigma factor [Hutsoniella sourekii]|uniref:RNA polymerase sigma factor n=1 Tax=Hutsoniella sourekii TaxID=87650 RepID=UPI000480391C|nr:sigma-70 family RNA polymerase sigma factor [Hutsoniella sourekii]
MKIILKSEPNSRSSYPVNTVYDITTEEVAIMIDADFELQKQELDDLSEAKKRPIEAIIKDLNKPEINNPKRFRDNTVSGLVKNSSGTYEDREYEASDGLNYHKRPPKDKKKDKKIDQPGGCLRYDNVPGRPKSPSFYFEDDYAEKMEQTELLHQAIQSLPLKEQDLIKQIYFEGRSQADFARAEGVSRPAINKRLNRAESKLKAKLAELGLTNPYIGD